MSPKLLLYPWSVRLELEALSRLAMMIQSQLKIVNIIGRFDRQKLGGGFPIFSQVRFVYVIDRLWLPRIYRSYTIPSSRAQPESVGGI